MTYRLINPHTGRISYHSRTERLAGAECHRPRWLVLFPLFAARNHLKLTIMIIRPTGGPVIGAPPATINKSQIGYDRKFSVGSIGSEDFRAFGATGMGGTFGSPPTRGGRGSVSGMDSGYYSSAMTSPMYSPHRTFSTLLCYKAFSDV